MKIEENFKWWIKNKIYETGRDMINTTLPSWTDPYALYNLLIPDIEQRKVLLQAGRWITPMIDQRLTAIPIHFQVYNSPLYYPKFDIVFIKERREHIDKTQFLLPHIIESISEGDPLHTLLEPAVKIAREWSSLSYVVEQMLSRITTDARSIGALFPWMRDIVIQSNWHNDFSLVDRENFYKAYGVRTKGQREACDEMMSAVIGPVRNVPMMTPLLTSIGQSGIRLFAQHRLLRQTLSEINLPHVSYISPTIDSSVMDQRIHKQFRDLNNVNLTGRSDDE